MKDEIKRLQEEIDASEYIVFFGGAGVSTESGIPDFRSQDGLYNQKYAYPPETIVSHSFLTRKTEEFYTFYKDKMLAPEAKPNKAHLKLAEMEEKGKLKAVITQNIDGLHEAAGSKNVINLHGTVLKNYCMSCHKAPSDDGIEFVKRIRKEEGIPRCEYCGGIVRPDVVLYEEALNEEAIISAIDNIKKADLLIIGGTSLVVYPAAGFVNYFRGKHMALINMSETSQDKRADIIIRDRIGEVFSQITV